jgi:hypothetical protein
MGRGWGASGMGEDRYARSLVFSCVLAFSRAFSHVLARSRLCATGTAP